MKKAVITGGSSGIGLSIVKMLVKNGYYVYNIDILESKFINNNLLQLTYDINDTNLILKEFIDINHIDLLINNAAIQVEKPFIDNTNEEIDVVLNTNLISLVKLTNKLISKMNNNSMILNISSVHGQKPRVNKITYDISKAALEMFTKELALELSPKIRVNALSIGATITPMNEMFNNQSHFENSLSKIPLKHVFEANDIANVVINLISEDFKYLTGSIIIYDGGRSLI